jgi:Zn-dependent protease with chaperone function
MRIAVAALLLAYAAAVSAAGTRWLPRAAWPHRAPRAGIATWLAGALSVTASWAGAGLILAIPCAELTTSPAMLRTCLSLLRAQYSAPAGATAGTAGGLLAAAVIGRLAWVSGSAMTAGRRRRARHDDALVVLGRPGPAADIRIIDSDRPAAYCLPGRRRIVFTTGALTRLDDSQLEAVLAHERAHLAERHHLVLAAAATLERAFPGIRFFAAASLQVTYLVEVAADDAATRRAPRLTLAAALLAVAASGVPAGTLGVGGSAAAQRIGRLIDPPLRGGIGQRTVTAAGLAAAAAASAAVLVLAAVTITRCMGLYAW